MRRELAWTFVAVAVAVAVADVGEASAQDPGGTPSGPGTGSASDPGSAAETGSGSGPATGSGSASDRIAVLMLPTGDVDAAMGEALTELLISQVAARRDGIGIVGTEEFQSQLGQGDAGTVECIESAACLGRVGVQLSVIEVIAGTIGRRTDPDGDLVWAFNLNRLDVRTGELLGRVFREVTGDLGTLLHALEESFPELYARRVQPGRLVVRATVLGADVELDGVPIGRYDGDAIRRETVEPGVHVLRVRAAGHRAFERELDIQEAETVVVEAALERGGAWSPSPLVWVGGAVAVASLAGAIGLGVASQATPDPALSMRDTIHVFYPARDAEALAANALFAVAAAGGIALGIGLLISGEDEPTGSELASPGPSVSAMVAPHHDGASAVIAGSF